MTRSPTTAAALLLIACGARSSLPGDANEMPPDASIRGADVGRAIVDAGVDRMVPPDVAVREVAGCGFEVTGAAQASVVGSVAFAELAGAEIPFLYLECEGASGGTVYDFTGQYEPGQTELQAGWLTVGGGSELTTPDAIPCRASVLLGGKLATPGEPYTTGEPFAMTFTCAFPDDAGQTYEITEGYLDVDLTNR